MALPEGWDDFSPDRDLPALRDLWCRLIAERRPVDARTLERVYFALGGTKTEVACSEDEGLADAVGY